MAAINKPFQSNSECRRHAPSPDGVVGGSKSIERTAVWSRDDLVPVGLSGYRTEEYALAHFQLFRRRPIPM